MAGERHGRGMLCVIRPLQFIFRRLASIPVEVKGII